MAVIRAADRPLKWERWALTLLVMLVVLFGLLVEFRSAYLSRRMGDLGCYLRAAWAVRTGADLYQVVDNNAWHYNYPPFLAILMVPLADPPAGADSAGMIPYPVSVALWYVFSVACLALGVHRLAQALEEQWAERGTPRPPAGSRLWWAMRLIPVAACLPTIGHSLMRGQVNLLVLALLCGMIGAVLRGRSTRAGVFLAIAASIKVYPLFLLAYPVWRRNGRMLAGCALGLALALGVVPLVTIGPRRTVEYYAEYYQVTLAPAMGIGEDRSRAAELTKITATDSQSLLAALHNTLNPDPWQRPEDAAPELRHIQLAVGVLMTLLTLLAAGWRRPLDGSAVLLLFGALVLVMLLLAPVCHLHYFSLTLPLFMGLLARRWEQFRSDYAGAAFLCLVGANVVANIVPHLPGLEVLRDQCLTTYMALLLWSVSLVVLWRRPAMAFQAAPITPELAAAA
jgi:hypothetical protein